VPPRRREWKRDDLRRAVAANKSAAGVLRAMGCPRSGSAHARLRTLIAELALDTIHWLGHAWNRGGTTSSSRPFQGRPLEQILTKGSGHTNRHYLKHRLRRAGLLPPTCAECGLAEWRGRPISLELDHVNGDKTDWRLENLRLLCPNCHSQTPTYCARNRDANRLMDGAVSPGAG
jgi:5-methylcytosine-specific restriction endonuclease McrA